MQCVQHASLSLTTADHLSRSVSRRCAIADRAVGRPIKVERIEKPTSKDLEEVQQRYIDELMHIWVRVATARLV